MSEQSTIENAPGDGTVRRGAHDEVPGPIGAGRYVPSRLLGEGGRKRVYLARDTRLDRDVAIALVKREGLDEATLLRLQREAQTTARLGDHPHIVTIHDTGDEDGELYIVTQYLPGGSVDDLLASAPGRRLDPAHAIRIGTQVCEALEHAHRHGVVHRDVKPANVWLAEDGAAKLGDFGLAVALDRSRLTAEGALVGTVAYMPPEQAFGRPAEPSGDLYALGATLYEMVTGRPPFLGDDVVAVISQHINTPPVAPSWHNAAISRPLEALILALLAKTPAARPASAAAVRRALGSIAAEPGTSKVPAGEHANPLDRLASGVFVGRERELAALRSALDDALSAHGRVVLLAGEAGIGKTRTAEALATYAELRDAQVLWGRCYEGEGAPAFWPWIQAIRTYAREREPAHLRAEMGAGAADIAQVVSVVRERLPDLPTPPALEPEHARFRLFDSITNFLANASHRQPLLLVLDDLHSADAPSLRLLEFLAPRLDGLRLLVVATHRDVDLGRHPLADALAQVGREPGTVRVALSGLDAHDVGRFIEVTAGLEPPDALVATVHRETEGNPFFVTEVVRLLVADRRLEQPGSVKSWSLNVPQGVREVVSRRMHHLSAECSRILSIASVLGREFRLDTLERLSELEGDRLLELADEAVASRILTEVPHTVGNYRFAHALIRETLYEELSATRRARLHRRAADALEQMDAGDVERHLNELAHHCFKAAEGDGDVDKAIDYAVRAAERARVLLAYEEAVRLCELALRAFELRGGRGERQRCELLLGLGEAQAHAGDGGAAVATFERAGESARRIGWAAGLARAALGAAGPWSGGAADPVVEHRLKEAVAALGPDDAALRARLLGRLAVDLVWSDRSARRLELAREAVELARGVADPAALAFALYCHHWVLMGTENLEERLAVATEIVEQAERIGDKAMSLHGRTQRIQDLLELGDVAAVERELVYHTRLVEELRQPLYQWYAALLRAMRAGLEGRFAEAEGFAYEALAIGQRVRPREAVQFFGAQAFPLADLQGKFDELEGGLAPLAAAVAENPAVPAWRAALAYTYCRLGRKAEAREEFERLAANGFQDLPRNQEWLVCTNTLALACAMLGDARRAASLYELLRPHARRTVMAGGAITCFGSVARALGLLAATRGRFEEAAAHFEAAVAANAAMGARPHMALALHDHASMLLTREAPGDREHALRLLAPALDTAAELGMKALVDSGLRLKACAQRLDQADVTASVDAVAARVQRERTDVRAHSAPDGTITILFTDIEGFTALTERLGDYGAQELLRVHNAILRRVVEATRGFEVKSQGDGFMIVFGSAVAGLRTAVEFQRALAARAESVPENPIRVRIGLHTGEAIREADDFFGRDVILAARIAALARGGTILVSETLHDLTQGAGEFRFDAGREVVLKGLSGTHRVFAVDWDGAVVPAQTHA